MKKIINALSILGLILFWSVDSLGQTTSVCRYFVGNKDITVLKPKIQGINSSVIDAKRFKSAQGIFIPCNFYYDSSHSRQLTIKSKRYTYKRDGKIMVSRVSKGPFLTDSIKRDLILVKAGDSLIIDQIIADLVFEDSTISLNNLGNFTFQPIELLFTSSLEIRTNEEIRFDLAMESVSGFKRLVDIYSSGANSDASFVLMDWKPKATGVRSRKRYQFKMGSRTQYDLTFTQNDKGAISKVYDNLRKKAYTIEQWEKIISRVK